MNSKKSLSPLARARELEADATNHDRLPEPGGEIGGYFGLSLPKWPLPFGKFSAFQSARAAFHAVLAASGFRRAYLPTYICNSIILAAQNAGLEVMLYDLDEEFLPIGLPDRLPEDTALIYVNYFGLAQKQVDRLVQTYDPTQIVIDQSQALFADESGTCADVFSPRKFVGLPDGGWVRPANAVSEPETEDDGSIDRLRHLMRRFSNSAREGYADFNAARLSLAETTPKRMSRLTRRLLHTIDWAATARNRRENYQKMASRLDPLNARPWPMAKDAVALCYPYTVPNADVAALRLKLADEYDIFTATYWPDVEDRAKTGSIEAMMTNQTLFLPVDQRLTVEQTDHVCDVVLELA